VFRRSAPNQDFAAPHVETLAPDFTSALPEPNVCGTKQPEYTVPMGPLSLDELRLLKMADSTAAALEHLKKLAHDSKACDAKFWYELALWHVDDVAIGTFDKDEIIGELTRRFGRITLHVNGGMFLGFDIVHDKEGKTLQMLLETHVERVVAAMIAKDPEDVTLRSNVGMLNWATSTIFGTHVQEARTLASRCNLEEIEDLETSIALIYELHSKRKQGILFRKLEDKAHIFEPRTSRVEGIDDVSAPHRTKATREGEVIVTKDDILAADDGYNVYEDDPLLKEGFVEEKMPILKMFEIVVCTDATHAPRGEDGRSDIMFIVFVNGSPVDWNTIRLKRRC
jgi:hypothetical protein